MAESYPISQIQIGDKTFEIVDAVARDSVALIYKWGRPGNDSRCPRLNSKNEPTNTTVNFKGKSIVIAHILPSRNEMTSSFNSTTGDEAAPWEAAWNYPKGANSQKFDWETDDSFLKGVDFAFGQLNIHTRQQNNTATGTQNDTFARNIRHFMLQGKRRNSTKQDYELHNFNTEDYTLIKEDWQDQEDGNKTKAGILRYSPWAWASFYTTSQSDMVTTNTYITSQFEDLIGVFGVDCDRRIVDIWGNATTVLFFNSNIIYNNLTPEETSEEESSNNNGS